MQQKNDLQYSFRPLSVLFLHLLLSHSCSGQSQLIAPSQPIVATVGDDIILPCHLKPEADVVAMTLEWTRPDLKPIFVHMRRASQDLVRSKHPSFKGRTSVSVNELKHGNVSLKLSKVKPSDAGRYKCYIPKLNTGSVVELIVGAASSLVISLSEINRIRGAVVLQCESTGWYPEPEVFWLDGEGNLLSAGPTETVRGPDDLYTVSSRVTVEKRHNNNFTCRVQQNSTNQIREAHIHVPEDFFQSSSSSLTTGLSVSLAVCILVILILGFLLWRQNKTREKNQKGEVPMEEEEMLMKSTSNEEQQKFLEEQQKFLEEQQKLKEEQQKFLEEQQKLKEEQQKLKEEQQKLKEEQQELKEEQQKLKEEQQKFLEEQQKFLEEQQKLKEDKQKLKEELQRREEAENRVQILEEELQKKIRELQEEKKKREEAEGEVQRKNQELQEKTDQIGNKDETIRKLQQERRDKEKAQSEVRMLKDHLESKNKEKQNSSSLSQNSTTEPAVVFKIDPLGRYIQLRNTSTEDQQLGGWVLKIQVNDEEPIKYTFKDSFKLKTEHIFTVGCCGYGRSVPRAHRVLEDLKSWSHTDNLQVSLISHPGEIQYNLVRVY